MKHTPISLNGTWRLRADDWQDTIPCSIPGDNYTALEAAERIPDPFYGENEWLVQWPVEKNWVFSHAFEVPAEF